MRERQVLPPDDLVDHEGCHQAEDQLEPNCCDEVDHHRQPTGPHARVGEHAPPVPEPRPVRGYTGASEKRNVVETHPDYVEQRQDRDGGEDHQRRQHHPGLEGKAQAPRSVLAPSARRSFPAPFGTRCALRLHWGLLSPPDPSLSWHRASRPRDSCQRSASGRPGCT
jgi:hypothetical protein